MREPVDASERPCAMGDTCECTKITRDPADGFVAVEFLLPGECRDESTPPHMCVLCHRKTVQTLFYDMVYSGTPCHCVIQRYGNICGAPNEYAREVRPSPPPRPAPREGDTLKHTHRGRR